MREAPIARARTVALAPTTPLAPLIAIRIRGRNPASRSPRSAVPSQPIRHNSAGAMDQSGRGVKQVAGAWMNSAKLPHGQSAIGPLAPSPSPKHPRKP